MKSGYLAVLLGYFDTQLEIVESIFREIQTTTPNTREKISHLGYLLHNLYCAMEDLFREVARTFENRLEDPSRYHRELLKKMHLVVPGIRPRLLSRESYLLLDELRAFRHVFRHAYEYELSAARMTELKAKLTDSWDTIKADLNDFSAFMQNQTND